MHWYAFSCYQGKKSCVLSVFSDKLPCYISDWFLKSSLFIFISDGKRWKDRPPASSPVSICHITLPWRPDVIMWYESKLSDTCPFVTVEVAQLRGAFPVTCTSDVGRLTSPPFGSKCSAIVKDDIRINGWNPSRFLNLLSLLHQSHKVMRCCEDYNRTQHPVHVTIFVRVVNLCI